MKSDKHILLITPGFPENEDDYLCTPMVQDMLIEFKKYFPDVKFTVVALEYPYHAITYNWNNISVVPLGGSNDKGLKKFFLWRQAIKTITDLNNEKLFTTIHSFWLGEAALLGNRASKKFSIPHICTMMGQDALPENSYLPFIDFKKLKLVAVSEFQADTLWDNSANKADAIIPWGIENKTFTSVPREIDLLGVGSLINLKNYKIFINVVKELIKEFPNLNCVLAGDGDQREQLQNNINYLSLQKNIKLIGNIERSKLFELMKKSKIFIHPSKYESFGFVFAEVLVHGMNIISRKTGASLDCEKWFIVKDDHDFYLLTKYLLKSNLNFESINPFPLEKTVKLYEGLYE